jgi:hypothetical protein
LLEGAADAYKATKLSRDIDAAPAEERPPLLQQAFLSSKLFKQMFETFHDDTVSKAKIEQRAKGLDVHPESAGECAQIFIDSAVEAGLGTLSGDSISLVKARSILPTAHPPTGEDAQEDTIGQNKDPADGHVEKTAPVARNTNETGPETLARQSGKPGVTLTLTVDPSSDPDKLEKQLKLLRDYGMI